jgi:hypothetical protein
VDRAKSNANAGYTNDVASDAKLCKRDDHPIQRDGSIKAYKKRFTEHHNDVWVDFCDFINEYLDEKQRRRLALSIIELIKDSNLPDNEPLFILDSPSDGLEKKEITEKKRDFNLPCLLAGVLFYIIDKNVPNGSDAAKATLNDWKDTFAELPNCPIGETVDTVGEVTFDLPPEDSKEVNDSAELCEEESEQSSTAETQPNDTPDFSENINYKDDYYNLCVYGQYEPGESFLDSGRVVITPDRALGTYLKDETKTIFGNLNDKATLLRIKSLPSIFACESNFSEHPNQEAVYGFITDVKIRDNGVNVYFDRVLTISQKALTGLSLNLAINQFEWSHSHWTIKNVNLCEELKAARLMDAPKTTNITQTGNNSTLVGNMNGGIIMNQYGKNSLQIPTISGGNNTFNLGGSSSRTAKTQDNNSADMMIEIFRKAIVDYKIVKFLKADPTVNLSSELPEYVDRFVEHIEDEIVQTFIHCQRNLIYKKIREFMMTTDSYNGYLSINMRFPNSDATHIYVPLFREENYQWAADFEKETIERRKAIDMIYGEILDGETLFV